MSKVINQFNLSLVGELLTQRVVQTKQMKKRLRHMIVISDRYIHRYCSDMQVTIETVSFIHSFTGAYVSRP